MAIKVTLENKEFFDTPFTRGKDYKTFTMKEVKEVFKNVHMHIEETETEILLFNDDVEVEVLEENGSSYAVFKYIKGDLSISYDKDKKTIITNLVEINTDTDGDCEAVGKWLLKVIFLENKYLYNVYSSTFHNGYYYVKTILTNTIRFINEKTFDQLEGVIKNLGMDFFEINIKNASFELKNSKKLHRVIELPKQVLDFIKKYGFSSQLSTFKMLANNNPNEVIYLTEWYETFKKYQNIKNDLSMFDQFMSLLAEIKPKFEKLDLFRFLPYIMGQRIWYESTVEDKFCIPYQETRTYRDYINLNGQLADPYPVCLVAAHNIAVRNNKILLDEEVCKKFEEVVKKYQPLEWTEPSGKYIIKAPRVATDFVDEGNALHHCLATYIELVANEQENVMFLRLARKPNESLITFAFDESYNAVEVKQMFNEDVEDPEIDEILKKWKIKSRKREEK